MTTPKKTPTPSKKRSTKARDHFTIVGIGASAGGLSALKRFFKDIPRDSGMAFVVVVHLSPEHKSHLAELLQAHLQIPVDQVTKTVQLEPNRVYVIPPNANLESIDSHLRLGKLETERRERAPIDHFFRTLASTHDGDSIGIVLTGTGSDGTLGLKSIQEQGGLTIVQDPNDAEFDGMPQSAIYSGVVDLILPLAEIPKKILSYRDIKPRLSIVDDAAELDKSASRVIQKIFNVLRTKTKRDFSRYKLSTMQRRIQRRMQLRQVEELSDYLELLQREIDEVERLADDLLITVTNFFRDPEVFLRLEKKIIPALFNGKGPGDDVRIWSVGCATGEEAYTLAILASEFASRLENPPSLQIFASDLHGSSLSKAREGLYPGGISIDVSQDRLKRFFISQEGGFRVRPEIRELIVFTPHNLLADPPFSRIDLISCRNLLIYIQRTAQREILELFHYALRPNGHLVLGNSESVEAGDLFTTVDSEQRLFQKSNVPSVEPRLPVFPTTRTLMPAPVDHEGDSVGDTTSYSVLHHSIAETFAPPSILINPDDRIVHLSEEAGRYLIHPGGVPTTSIIKLARRELRIELRSLINAARKTTQPISTQPITVRIDNAHQKVVMKARAARQSNHAGYILIVFDQSAEALGKSNQPSPQLSTDMPLEPQRPETELEHELELTRQRLHAIVSGYETSQEEMKASNEELQSANEELRSTMEELETSKEELQSMNEELQTVNQENRHKVEELALLSSDLQNLLNATDIATLFLNRDLCIMRFTPKVEEIFSIRSTDRGRPLTDLTHQLGEERLEADARSVLKQLIPTKREVQSKTGHWYLVRTRPYRSSADQIEGVVITLVDVTIQKEAELKVQQDKLNAERIIAGLPEPLIILKPDLSVHLCNDAFCDLFDLSPRKLGGQKIYELVNGQWNLPDLKTLLEEVLPENKRFKNYQLQANFGKLGKKVMLLNACRLENLDLILLGVHDMTERHEAERLLRESENRLQKMLNIEGIGVLVLDKNGTILEGNDAFLTLLGRNRREIEADALNWRDLAPASSKKKTETPLDKAPENDRIGPFEKECLKPNGDRKWMLFVGASLSEDRIVKYCVDISDRKRAQAALIESEQSLEAELAAMTRLHELVAQIFVSPDLSTALNDVLSASVDILGAKMGAVQLWESDSNRLNLFTHRGFKKKSLPHLENLALSEDSAPTEAARSKTRVVVEDIPNHPLYANNKKGPELAGYQSVQSTPLVSRSNTLLGVLSTFYPTPHETSEREMKILDLYARQAADFIEHVRNRDKAKRDNRRKDEFIATLAHELRNPLAPVTSCLHILSDPNLDKAESSKLLTTIDRQIRQLVALVDDLLDVSRITQGRLELKKKTVSLSHIVQCAFEESEDLIKSAGHTFERNEPSEDIQFEADPIRLAQVISNLLNNAAKYTPQGGHIWFTSKREDDCVSISVADDGIGIAPDQLNSIFEIFTQVGPSDRASGTGLGIGLSLVKSLVEKHDGTITVQSGGKNKGATFTVKIPLSNTEPSPPKNTPKVQSKFRNTSGKSKRVLLADDNAMNVLVLRRLIQLAGHEVKTAEDGYSALEICETFFPEVVILDIGMPGLDGHSTAQRIRKEAWGKDMVLIALTGWGRDSDKLKSKEAGFDFHLVKPPEPKDLLDLINADLKESLQNSSVAEPKR